MNQSRGFTLIETIIYLGLFGILIFGIIVTAYNLMATQQITAAKAVAQNEADFLINKIDWLLASSSSVSSPLPNQSTHNLILTNSGETLTLSLSDSSIRLTDTHGEVALNSTNAPVSELNFTQNANKVFSFEFKINNQIFTSEKYLQP